MKSIVYTAVAGVLVLVLLSCGSNVSTEKTVDRDLSNYETFAFLPNTNPEEAGPAYDDEEVNRQVIETVRDNLREAGYSLDREDPDLLVLISTRTNREAQEGLSRDYAAYPYRSRTTGVTSYYGDYYFSGYRDVNNVVGYDTETYDYKEGTVIIDLIDRETNETVWKGVASDRIFDDNSVEEVEEMVNDIFEEYPLRD